MRWEAEAKDTSSVSGLSYRKATGALKTLSKAALKAVAWNV